MRLDVRAKAGISLNWDCWHRQNFSEIHSTWVQ